MTDLRMDRRRFLGGVAMFGAAAVMGPAGLAAMRSAGARTVPPPGPAPVIHVHPAHPVLPASRYRTVVETRHTPAGVPYLEVLARPV